MTHANLDGIPKTIAVGGSLELLVISSLSFVSFFCTKWILLYLEGRAHQTGHAPELLFSARARAKQGGMCGYSSAVATHIQPCTWNCQFRLLPGVWARKRTWLKNAGSHLTDSCIPVLPAKRILKLRCESHGQSICRWSRAGGWWLLEQQDPASSVLAPCGLR